MPQLWSGHIQIRNVRLQVLVPIEENHDAEVYNGQGFWSVVSLFGRK